MSKDSEINRRDFIKTTARTGAGLAALGGISFFPKPERIFGANDRVRIAVVGMHGQGKAHFERILEDAQRGNRRRVRCG